MCTKEKPTRVGAVLHVSRTRPSRREAWREPERPGGRMRGAPGTRPLSCGSSRLGAAPARGGLRGAAASVCVPGTGEQSAGSSSSFR